MTGTWLEWVIAALLVLGGTFGLIGSFGLLRLAHPLQRLHAPTKAATLGLAAVMAAAAVWLWVRTGEVTGQEILLIILIFVTAPLSAFYLAKQFIARAATVREQPEGESDPMTVLPDTGTGSAWATLSPDRADRGG